MTLTLRLHTIARCLPRQMTIMADQRARDGVLVEFASAVSAVQCAVDLQQAMESANRKLPHDRQIVLRVGLNLGDVVFEGDDLYGDGSDAPTSMRATTSERWARCERRFA